MIPMLFGRVNLTDPWPHYVDGNAVADLPTSWDTLSFSYRYHGGFDKLTLKIVRDKNEAWRWLLDFLGCHLELYDEHTETAFEGLLWDIKANWGGGFVRRANLGEVCNRVKLNYSLISANEQTDRNTPERSAVQNDTDSQARWGIIERHDQESARNVAEALSLTTKMVQERAWPEIGPLDLNIPAGSGPPTLSIEVAGYWNTLRYRTYENNAAGTATTQAIVSNIVDGTYNPGGGEFYCEMLSDFTGRINGTGLGGVEINSTEELSVQDKIVDLVNLGGAAPDYDRYFVGVWENRELWIWPGPYSSRYGFVADPDYWIDRGRVYTAHGVEVPAYKVRPGKIVMLLGKDSLNERPGQGSAGESKFCVTDTSYDALSQRARWKGRYGSQGLDEQLAQISLEE